MIKILSGMDIESAADGGFHNIEWQFDEGRLLSDSP